VNERRLFENDTTNLTRKVTFWGTTNLPYLHPGQNTRWISIPVKTINHNYNNTATGVAEVDIHSVWAEAYAAYMAGESYEISREEMAEQERLNMEWLIGSEAMGVVSTYVRPGGGEWFTVEQIINTLSPANPNIMRRINARNLTEALRAHNIPSRIEKLGTGFKIATYECIVSVSGPEKNSDKPPF